MAGGPMYTTSSGVSLFSGLTAGGSIVPISVGISILTTGLVVKLVNEQLKAATGEKPDFAGALREAGLCFVLLFIHGAVATTVWSTCQYIATSIYPQTKMTALADLMVSVVSRFKDYSFSVMDIGSALKDTSVVMVALGSWLLALMAHWQLETLQVSVFNIVFAFGPILIGLSMFGFGGRRIWFSALIEVSSWSITMAIVYATLDSALHNYLQDAQTMDFKDTKFIDVISMLAFMASLPFIVPIVTGRLLGTQALGALANVTAGGTFTDRFFSAGRQAAQELGGGVSPSSGGDVVGHTEAEANKPILKRPGD